MSWTKRAIEYMEGGLSKEEATALVQQEREAAERLCQYDEERCDDEAAPRSNYCRRHQAALQIQHAAEDSE